MKGQPYKALKSVGGSEIAAIVGGILEASERNVPVLIDGFICTTAAMIACQINPLATRALLLATESTERGQTIALDEIAKIALDNGLPPLESPALRMKLRMGEGTGALTAVPLLRSACSILSMGTLERVLSLEAEKTSC
jgi:nicotinate-nucleotide--dimethylbenzimidazole phosphoribosyltransferase